MINFNEGEVTISGHIGLGQLPTLACGEWNGKSLDDMSEEELRAVVGRMQALCDQKFPKG